MSSVQGLSEMQDLGRRIEEAAKGLTDKQGVQVARAIEKEYRRLKRSIPKDSGALAKSLTRRSDRAHYEVREPTRIQYGSNLPQAKYQAKNLPDINPDPVVITVGNAIFDKIRGVLDA